MTMEETREKEEPMDFAVLDEAEEEEGMSTLSSLALHGIEVATKNQTMKIFGYIKKRRLNVLIDSGSTHNFMDLTVAKQMGVSYSED